MPEMPSTPPVDVLLNFENRIRNSTNEEMLRVVDDLEGVVESYWYDWVKILASHWAGKRGDVELQSKLLLSTGFEGYHFFNR
jgi:hypothetical protein